MNTNLVNDHTIRLCKFLYDANVGSPAMCTRNGEIYASYGVMGGFMQPQGHIQVLLNMIHFGMDPQQALDVPRFCISIGEWSNEKRSDVIDVEDGVPEHVVEKLKAKGHPIRVVKEWHRSVFGRGQIITRDSSTGLLTGGSDPRADGCAIGLL